MDAQQNKLVNEQARMEAESIRAERDRLAAELETRTNSLRSIGESYVPLVAERDRLTAELSYTEQARDAYLQRMNELQAERDRLRAALERIGQDEFSPDYTNAADWGDDYWRVVNIAREALAGGAICIK